MLISAGIFSIGHLTPTAIPPLFLMGFAFAYLYEQSRSIWPAILMHVLSNALALAAAYALAQTGLVP